MENLILFCGNHAQGDERIMNVLEIVVLILREQVHRFRIEIRSLSSQSSLQKNWLRQVNNNRKTNARKTTSNYD